MSIIQPPKPGTVTAPYIRRMMEEGDQLAQKIAALHAFTQTDTFKGLQPLDAHMLTLQAEVMQSYLHILTIRLARASDEAKGRLPDTATALGKRPLSTGKLDVN